MNIEVRIRAAGNSFAWSTGDAVEDLDAAIIFLGEQRKLIVTTPSKPIVTDDPDFVLKEPK